MSTSSPALLAATLAALLGLGCNHDAAEPTPLVTSTSPTPGATAGAPAGPDPARLRCEAERDRLAALPALPGAPGFEAKRAEILGRGKGEAVVWLRAPDEPTGLDLRLSLFHDRLAKGSPLKSVPSITEGLKWFPDDARRVLLREGYVYAESPELATTFVDVLKLGRLFREPTIYLQRGAATHRLVRDDKAGTYRFAEGEFQGDEASLLLADRVALTPEGLAKPLHRDLAKLRQNDAPDRLRITRLTEAGALAELRYGDTWSPAVLADDGVSYSVSCLMPAPDKAAEVATRRDANVARMRAIAPVAEAVRAMVAERLRFDEPLEEVGQQDGSLRPLWRWAYDHGGDGYSMNGVGYRVFDLQGRPSPPQVCIDFVLDAYERASGTWFRANADGRERTHGPVDFENGLVNRRSAAEFVKFAEAHPEMFRTWTPAEEERVIYGRRSEFVASLVANEERFHVGDAIVIHGPKADGQPHYHSFLIDAIDPIAGIPYRLSGNAGRPRFSSWEGVMRSAPMRSIRHVVSPELAWLVATMPAARDTVASREK